MPNQETVTEIVERRMVTEVRKPARVKDVGGKLVWWCPFCDRSSEMDQVRCGGNRENGEACEATIELDPNTGAYHAVGRSEVVETLAGSPPSNDALTRSLDDQQRALDRRMLMLTEKEAALKKQSKEQDERQIALHSRAADIDKRERELPKLKPAKTSVSRRRK